MDASSQNRPGRGTLLTLFGGLGVVAGAPAFGGPWSDALYGFVLAILCGVLSVRWAALVRLLKRTPPGFAFSRSEGGRWPVYTIIAPIYGEADGVSALVDAITALDYPKERLQLIIATEVDDPATNEAARGAAADLPFVEIRATPAGRPRTKGRACNHALSYARGEFLVVYDAEDRPERDQLKRAVGAFRADSDQLVCLQARLVIDNGAESLLARMMEAEYAAHFRAFLPLLSAKGWPLPLSGSSNHFRTAALRRLGGWDAWNVTEDADLGLRLARAGWRTGLLDSKTYEEAPARLAVWMRQRARWMKGFLQTACAHLSTPRAFGREAGWGGAAVMATTIAGGVAPPLLFWPLSVGPVAAWMWGAPPAVFPVSIGLTVSALGLGAAMSLAAFGIENTTPATRLKLALFAPIYWIFLTSAAVLAVKDAFLAPHHWRKTPHGSAARARHSQRAAPERRTPPIHRTH